jgi:hypothetical protein
MKFPPSVPSGHQKRSGTSPRDENASKKEQSLGSTSVKFIAMGGNVSAAD